jgi:hypothetical protein
VMLSVVPVTVGLVYNFAFIRLMTCMLFVRHLLVV